MCSSTVSTCDVLCRRLLFVRHASGSTGEGDSSRERKHIHLMLRPWHACIAYTRAAPTMEHATITRGSATARIFHLAAIVSASNGHFVSSKCEMKISVTENTIYFYFSCTAVEAFLRGQTGVRTNEAHPRHSLSVESTRTRQSISMIKAKGLSCPIPLLPPPVSLSSHLFVCVRVPISCFVVLFVVLPSPRR